AEPEGVEPLPRRLARALGRSVVQPGSVRGSAFAGGEGQRPEEAAMTDREREDLLRRLEDLERDNRRLRSTARTTNWVLAVRCLVLLALGLGVTARWQAELTRLRDAETEGRRQAQEALYREMVAREQAQRFLQQDMLKEAP